MEDIFANPYWHSLLTEHAGIAIGSALARRFPSDVIPFAGAPTWNEATLTALRNLLTPNESIIVTGDPIPSIPGLEPTLDLPGLQMHVEAPPPNPDPNHSRTIRELHPEDAPAMVALTDIAFPGYFRPRTYILGQYFGIEILGQLIAMAGERLALPGYREISAVCTHPAHTGKGYAAALVQHLLRVHAAAGLRSFLHVAQANTRAVALYERLGFTTTRSIHFHGIRRTLP
jgi:ribosomal protein S18 acetylase RimI-like enzyme